MIKITLKLPVTSRVFESIPVVAETAITALHMAIDVMKPDYDVTGISRLDTFVDWCERHGIKITMETRA